MKIVNLNDMYVFTKVAENKSITIASRAMNTSKQTISRKIVQLEESLGVSLILRNTRNFELTSAGQEYYENCIRIIEQAEQANVRVKELQNSPVGAVRVSMPRLFCSDVVTEVLGKFLSDNPELELDVKLADHKVCLVNDSIDVALKVGRLQDSSMIARSLGKIHFCYVASPSYLAEYGRPTNLDELGSRTSICVEGSHVGSTNMSPKNGKRIAVNDYLMAKQFALSGAGIAVLPVFACKEELANGSLLVLEEPCFNFSTEVNLLFLKSKFIPGYVRRFIDFMVQQCKPNAPWEYTVEDAEAFNRIETDQAEFNPMRYELPLERKAS